MATLCIISYSMKFQSYKRLKATEDMMKKSTPIAIALCLIMFLTMFIKTFMSKSTYVFYCDPSSPHQKGACEVNHELIRRIVPKGKSFDDCTQDDIFLMMDHINSYKRKKLNNRSPYDAFSFYYGEEILEKLACKLVAAENIILKPRLLKK